jgi:5-(aminomethyl)-3-furanmethanol phosphate kinase
MLVVKVGGSLYAHPKLGPALRDYLESLGEPVLLVPGGGPFADAVRAMDRVHGLGDESCHWLALEAMNLGGAFLTSLGIASTVLDAVQFCREHDELPHSWAVTSDSIAALAVRVQRGTRLVLLKSIDIPDGTPWEEAAAQGWVDSHFPSVMRKAAFAVDVVNFRNRLEGMA